MLILTLGIALADWLSTQTERFYLDENADVKQQTGIAGQHFAILGHNVVPQIISQDNARFVFPANLQLPHKLIFKVTPGGSSSYEIYLREGASRRLLASDTISKSSSRSIWIPRCVGALEFVGHGAITWTDLRLVRPFFLWPIYAIATVGLVISIVKRSRITSVRGAELLTLAVSTLLALGLAEFVLRVYALKLPPVIVAARHDLGLVGTDTRLIDLKRYNLRIRPNLDTYFEWRYGDIVRWGVIPQSASRGVLHRYPFRTDAEGFRNNAVREKIDVAALGDSFTDAANSPVEESWPAQLEKITGLVVQNFGTSGFGPQQELYVLQDFALPRKPQWTVLAFFGGNDLHDAEVFGQWESAGRPASQDTAGWKLTRSFRRYQTQYLWTLASVAIDSIWGHTRLLTTDRDARDAPHRQPDFKDGVFTLPIAGHITQFAFGPYYLRGMAMTRPELERSLGWEITQSVLSKMEAECAAAGSKFLVMLVPSKEQVYWPFVQSSVAPGTLQQALDYYGRSMNVELRPEDLVANRLELNLMVRDFCMLENIPLLDLTSAQQTKFESGLDTYFPDDSHWNAAGHKLAAEELAAFLRSSEP